MKNEAWEILHIVYGIIHTVFAHVNNQKNNRKLMLHDVTEIQPFFNRLNHPSDVERRENG